MKHAAVDHVVKDLRQFFVGKGVHYEESDCHSSFSAASIENQPCDLIGGFNECCLSSGDVPRRFVSIGGFEASLSIRLCAGKQYLAQNGTQEADNKRPGDDSGRDSVEFVVEHSHHIIVILIAEISSHHEPD